MSMSGDFCPPQRLFVPTHNCSSRPLALPPPRMWSPMDSSYGQYYRPCFGHSAHSSPMRSCHASNCCLSSHCQQFCHNCNQNQFDCNPSHSWTDSQPIITEESGDDLNGQRYESDVGQDNGSTLDGNEEVDESDHKSNLDQLKAFNQTLRLSLEKSTEKLRETQISLIKLSEKLALDYIEKYRIELKKYSDYIRLECTRFYHNESMSKKLEPIVEQITIASNRAKEEKERIREKIASQKAMLSEEINANYEVFVFDYKSLPEFPDLLTLYKNIIDEIPLQFFDDLTLLKKSAKQFTQCKVRCDLNEAISDNDLNVDSVVSNQQEIEIQNIRESPKPVVNESEVKKLNIKQDLKPKDIFPIIPLPYVEAPLLGVIPLPFSSSDSTLRINTNVNLTNHKVLTVDFKAENTSSEPIIKTKEQTCDDSFDTKQSRASFDRQLANSQKKKENVKSNEKSKQTEDLKPKEMLKTNEKSEQTEDLKPKEMVKSTEAPKLSQSQSKLLERIKSLDKYKNISEEVLIECMAKTKELVISCGNPNGFSGMKVTDVIKKICHVIDKEIEVEKIPKGWNNTVGQLWFKTSGKCGICLEKMFDRYDTSCHHSFHNLCINKWKKTQNLCPICSKPLK